MTNKYTQINVLSLFDGMACGRIALDKSDLTVGGYDAYEIDKHAITLATSNYQDITEHGDVFNADFAKHEGVDILVGGSPCTYWSIAQTKYRETEASGIGWELFKQYLRAIKEAKPKFFIYENNKSMSSQIRASIDEAFGFDAIEINSALVSAQNRKRLYWVGKRELDGTYSKVAIAAPKDRGILLRDVLENGCDLTSNEKSFTLTASYGGAVPWNTIERHQKNMVALPINTTADGKAKCLRATCYKDGIRNLIANNIDRRTCIAAPIRVGSFPRPNGELSTSQGMRIYSVNAKGVPQTANGGGLGAKTGLYAVPLTQTKDGESFVITANYKNMTDYPNDYAAHSIEKSVKPVVAESYIGQDTPSKVYEVRDGMITIRDKQYPIKLEDGYYIIRKLSVRECARLQTVPETYNFSSVSKTQAYKCLGNGWTVDVIVHILRSIFRNTEDDKTK